jgi:hypothetical protein
LNILDKALKSIIAQRINDLTKTHDLLSINQMSERRNRSCETTLKLLIEQIHTVWNMSKDKMITLLSMNVVEIYDHVSKARLLHNLRKSRILTWIIVWTNNFMQDRRITLVINSDTTTMNNVNVDISQNSFVSLILYLFYNADLLKLLKRSFRRVAALNFVNDINILTYEFSITSNCRILKKMHAHCETWACRHEVVFASIKYELIHLTRNSRKFDMQTIVRLCDVVKQSFNQIRVLKVQIDIKLKWRTHVKSIQKKMIIQTLTLSRLIVFIWETCFVKTRLIYKTIIRSAVIYASIIWHASHDRSDNVVDTMTKLIKMQQQCLRMISDNFKAMSTQILEVEIYVKFIQLHLTHLQINFRQRMKKKQHDVFISNFCSRIKSRLTTQRDKRRTRAVKTSNERKQKWSAKLAKKMRKKNKMNEESIEKTWHKLFRVKWQQTWNVYQTKNRRRVLDADRWHFEQEIEIAQNLDEVRERFRHAHAYETHWARWLSVLSTRVYCAIVWLLLRLFSTNAQARAVFLHEQSNKQTTHVKSRRNDESTQVIEHREETQDVDKLIDENQSINSMFSD